MMRISLFLDDLTPLTPPVSQAEEAQYAVEQPLKAIKGAQEEKQEQPCQDAYDDTCNSTSTQAVVGCRGGHAGGAACT